MTRLYANNLAYNTLDVAINSTSTSMTVTDIATFPSSDEVPYVVVVGSEIMLVENSALAARRMDVERGYEGTTPSSHAADTVVANKITAGYINNFYDHADTKVPSTEDSTLTGNLDVVGNISSTGDLAVVGDVNITGAVNATGNLAVEGTITSTGIVTLSTAALVNPHISGGVLLDAFDANNQPFNRPVIKNYTEIIAANATVGAGALTLDLSSGNVFVYGYDGNITGIDITNASTDANSLSLSLMPYSSALTVAWMAPVAVIAASTIVTASTVDQSFNTTGAFSTQVMPGDIIAVSGFTSDHPTNNGNFRIKTASTLKLAVDSTLITTSTGSSDEVVVTRRQEFFQGAVVPSAPSAFTPTEFTMWSYGDATRWRISEVGGF